MKKFSSRKINFVLISVIVLSVIILVEFTGILRTKKEVAVEIPEGTAVSSLAGILKENKLIGSEFLFKMYCKTQNGILQSGVHKYRIKSYSSLFSTSCENTSTGITVTVTEGMEFDEIAKLLESKGLGNYDDFVSEAKIDKFDYWFLKGLPKREFELEGYLYPDTYSFSKSQSQHEILDIMLKNFDNKFDDSMRKQAESMGKSVDEIITLASIVEREAAAKSEFDIVAGIFYNRINKVGESKGYLESCATVQYILKERKSVLSVSDTKIDSPYNTYKYQGLPVGPIASPGLVAIKAALHPKKTKYLYFVAKGDGTHLFAETYDKHKENIKKVGL